jgi:hypothetical protein
MRCTKRRTLEPDVHSGRGPSGAMSTLCWNCWGLGQPQTVQEHVHLVRNVCPAIVFISEIRQQVNRVTNLKGRLGMYNCFVIEGRGKGGGLDLFWNNSIKISVVLYDLHHIDTLIWDGVHHAAWWGTFVYGEPKTQDRHNMWELLKRLKTCHYAPWLVIGDFNEVLWEHEHLSCHRRPTQQMIDFREVLS